MAASGGTRPASANLMTAYVMLQGSSPVCRGVACGYHGRAVGCSRLPVAGSRRRHDRGHRRRGGDGRAPGGAAAAATDNTAGLLARCNAGSQDAFTAKMHATASRLGRTGPRPPPEGQSGSRHESDGRLKGHPSAMTGRPRPRTASPADRAGARREPCCPARVPNRPRRRTAARSARAPETPRNGK
jgi:hypothetical protein